MKYCPHCGAEIADDVRFCPTCGKETVVVVNDAEPQFDPQDVADNKMLAMLGYLSMGVLPMLGCRNSRHVEDNARVASLCLTNGETEKIRAFISAYPTPEGEPFTLERTPGSRYRSIMKMNLNKA